jgi:hypothetical protein
MNPPPFKQVKVADRHNRYREATFTRPVETSPEVVINTNGRPFHTDAATLRLVGEALDDLPQQPQNPSKKI